MDAQASRQVLAGWRAPHSGNGTCPRRVGDGDERSEELRRVLDRGPAPVTVVIADADPTRQAQYEAYAAGWDLRVREPGHRRLRAEPDAPRPVGEPVLPANLHCYQPTSPESGQYPCLRNRLRADPAARAHYAELKRSLAAREWPDMNLYADTKVPLVRELLGGPSRGS